MINIYSNTQFVDPSKDEMNYFKDRSEAGKILADELTKFKVNNSTVIALSEGAILVGAEIARNLHSSLFIFASQKVDGSGDQDLAAVDSRGAFSYNTSFSFGEIEEDMESFKQFVDQRSLNDFQKLNHVAGLNGTIPKKLLEKHVVILVSDGLKNAMSLQIAAHFMRMVEVKKLIISTPIASTEAVDKMHISVDQIFCLRIVENYISASHYYENNQIPDDKTVVEIMQNIVLNWDNSHKNLAANK